MSKHIPANGTAAAADPDPGEIHEASEFRLLLDEASRMAVAEGIDTSDLEEMDAINQMRVVAESIINEEYICHTGV